MQRSVMTLDLERFLDYGTHFCSQILIINSHTRTSFLPRQKLCCPSAYNVLSAYVFTKKTPLIVSLLPSSISHNTYALGSRYCSYHLAV